MCYSLYSKEISLDDIIIHVVSSSEHNQSEIIIVQCVVQTDMCQNRQIDRSVCDVCCINYVLLNLYLQLVQDNKHLLRLKFIQRSILLM
jgi:hypothetical protein